MNTLNFSRLGHSYLRYANPLSEEKINAAIDFCSTKKLSSAIDIGAGNFYLLKQMVARACVTGTGG